MVGSALLRHGSTNVGQPAAGRGPPLGIHIRRQAKGAKVMMPGKMDPLRYLVKTSVEQDVRYHGCVTGLSARKVKGAVKVFGARPTE
jgi:hypothetical protein